VRRLLTGLCLGLAGTVQAQTPVNITVSSGGGTISTYTNVHRAGAGTGSSATGGFAVQLTSINGVSVSLSPHATFCTELGETISFQNYTAFEIVPLELASAGTAGDPGTASSSIPAGGIGLQAAAQLRYLFDVYYVSETLSSWTTTQSQAFQMAVWEIGHDPGNFNIVDGTSGGGVYYLPVQNNAGRDAARLLAQDMLNVVEAANVSTGYASTKVDVWSLADDNGVSATVGYQDILFATFKTSSDGQIVTPLLPTPVPEPSSLAMLAIGAVALWRRNRRA
jgi:hypothetical protein